MRARMLGRVLADAGGEHEGVEPAEGGREHAGVEPDAIDEMVERERRLRVVARLAGRACRC